MTRICLVGTEDVTLRYELLSRETARDALSTYDLREPFENTVAVETVSLGGAISLLNDLNWYLIRFARTALVLEPSVSETEWLSRDLANAVRDDELHAEETDRFLKVYGIERDTAGESETEAPTRNDVEIADRSPGDADDEPAGESETGVESPPRLVEPMLVTRTGETIPEYDIRDVEDTLVVRVTQTEFGA